MKPERIILVRHCESLGNADPSVYEHTPDWKIPLTDKGRKEANSVSKKILKKTNINPVTLRNHIHPAYCFAYSAAPLVAVYSSPWYRTRQTAAPFLRDLEDIPDLRKSLITLPKCYTYKEDPRLREQEWGNFKEEPWSGKIGRERVKFGTFFYRIPFGESGADVYDRISTFNETLHRDFKKGNFPKNVVIFSHGLTIRIFLMRWLHWTVEEFQNLRNPSNGQIIEMVLENGKYVLKTKLRKKDPNFKQKNSWDV